MAFYWQLTGHNGHFRYDWKISKAEAIRLLAESVFDASNTKGENGFRSPIDLILGIEESGASHILLPISWKKMYTFLNWKDDHPYPASRFASLSPIRIDSPLRLETLIKQRENTAKKTKASKMKVDNSKANGRYLKSWPNLARATFEHGRCLWRIMNETIQPSLYGLPDAPWSKNIVIFSISFNFWRPDGGRPVDTLIDAAISKLDRKTTEGREHGLPTTWYFRVEEHSTLRNVSAGSAQFIPETWTSSTLPSHEIGSRIVEILDSYSKVDGEQVLPIVVLVHDYDSFYQEQLHTHGVSNNGWTSDIGQLLGFQTLAHRCKMDETKMEEIKHQLPSRARSRSPTRRGSKPYISKRENSPLPSYHRSVYIVDVLTTYKSVTGRPKCVRPVVVYNDVTQQKKIDTGCAGDDANYILDSWIAMVEGPSIDEQNALFEEYTTRVASEVEFPNNNASEQPEDAGLFVPMAHNHVGVSNDESDSDSD